MSDLDRISGDFRAMSSGVTTGQRIAIAAGASVDEAIVQAARSGFTGVVVGLQAVRSGVGELEAGLIAAHAQVAEAAKLTVRVPSEMTPQEVIQVLTPVGQGLDAIQRGLDASTATLAEVRRLAVATLRGGQPGAIVAALENVKQVVEQVERRRAETKRHVEELIAAAAKVGVSGN
jgi:hypothetical protein